MVYTNKIAMQFKMNFGANTFHMKMNGLSVFTSVAFSNNTNSIDTIQLERYSNQNAYCKRVKIGAGII